MKKGGYEVKCVAHLLMKLGCLFSVYANVLGNNCNISDLFVVFLTEKHGDVVGDETTQKDC